MLSKEFRTVSRLLSICFALYLLGILFAFIQNKLLVSDSDFLREAIVFSWRPFALLVTFLLANFLFSQEKTYSSFEYLFTAPISRMTLLWIKIFPRFVGILILLGISLIISSAFRSAHFIINEKLFCYLFALITLFSLSFSLLNRRNEINLITSLLFLVFICCEIYFAFHFSIELQALIQHHHVGRDELVVLLVENLWVLLFTGLIFSVILILYFFYLFINKTDINFISKIYRRLFLFLLMLLVPTFLFLFFRSDYLWNVVGDHSSELRVDLAPEGALFVSHNGKRYLLNNGVRKSLNLPNDRGQFEIIARESPEGWETFLWNGGALFRFRARDNSMSLVWKGRTDHDYSIIRVSNKIFIFAQPSASLNFPQKTLSHSALISINLTANNFISESVEFKAPPFFLSLTNSGAGEKIFLAFTYYKKETEVFIKQNLKWTMLSFNLNNVLERICKKYKQFAYLEPKIKSGKFGLAKFFLDSDFHYTRRMPSWTNEEIGKIYLIDEGYSLLLLPSVPTKNSYSKTHLLFINSLGETNCRKSEFEFLQLLGSKYAMVFFIATKDNKLFFVERNLESGNETYYPLPRNWKNSDRIENCIFFFEKNSPTLLSTDGVFQFKNGSIKVLEVNKMNLIEISRNLLIHSSFYGFKLLDFKPYGIVAGETEYSEMKINFFNPFLFRERREGVFIKKVFTLPSLDKIDILW